ncbi:MAG: arginine--tRNA ligase [Planctomycetota bacterium]
MNHRRRVAELLADSLGVAFKSDLNANALTLDAIEALIETPKDTKLADLAFPCFVLAKSLRKAPAAIAQQLAAELGARELGAELSSVSAVGPYVNFFINKAGRAGQVLSAILSGEFLARRRARGERLMIEYSQPNTHKAFHVGHARNVALGDALIRICEWVGYEVIATNYIGDEGTHIAKCLWYYQNHFRGEVPEHGRGEFLGELYARATELVELDGLTQVPMIGVVCACVRAIASHPVNSSWQVVDLETGGEPRRVVCGGRGYQVGDLVAYAKPGCEVDGRLVQSSDKQGVLSEGMILSRQELGLADDRQQIEVLPVGTELGVEVAEVYRKPGAVAASESVLAVWRARARGVADVLSALEAGDPAMTALWRTTREWSLAEFHEIYDWLGARFDHYFYESEVGETGREIVKQYYERGVFTLSDGAIGADLSRFKLPFFLLLKRNGSGLYSTKDVALARLKFERFHIDKSVYVVDYTQSLHFQQLFRTLELMGYEKARNCFHLAYGMVVTPEGKMSSRKGNAILFSQLRGPLLQKIRSEFLDSYAGDWPAAEIDAAARRITVAIVRYAMLNQDNLKNIVFDLTEWMNRRGNTGPYLLYAYTRTRSILRELAILENAGAQPVRREYDWSLLVHELEEELIRVLAEFPATVERAADTHAPQQLCIYLYDLCKAFSRMFENCPVLKAETAELRAARGALVDATGRVIRAGLQLLGIETLERM